MKKVVLKIKKHIIEIAIVLLLILSTINFIETLMLKSSVESLEYRASSLKSDVESLEHDVSSLESYMGDLEWGLNSLKERIY